eukprot:COSAG06_NODE_7897_length_2338_cov_9.835194_1_plen_220_part_00
MCTASGVACTTNQLQRALDARDNTCCFGHGTIAPGGCACDYGYGPEVSDTEALCGQDMSCTASQLQRALQAGQAEECGGEHFPGSRLITAERGDNLDGWMPAKVKGKQWSLCFNSFTDDATTPSTFHRLCDQHNATLTVARNSLNYTFGGYVRFSPALFRSFSVFFFVRLFRGADRARQTEEVGRGRYLAEWQIALLPLLARCLSLLLAAPLFHPFQSR